MKKLNSFEQGIKDTNKTIQETLKAISSLNNDDIVYMKQKQEEVGSFSKTDIDDLLLNSSSKSVEESIHKDLTDLGIIGRKVTENENKGKSINVGVKTLDMSKLKSTTKLPNISLTVKKEIKPSSLFRKNLDKVVENFNSTKVSRLQEYLPHFTNMIEELKTLEDYQELTKWFEWYVEEDKGTISYHNRLVLFIMVVLGEVNVFKTYGVDISEVATNVTVDKFQVNTVEDFQQATLHITNYITKVINNNLNTFNTELIEGQVFAQIRGECFRKLYESLA